MQCPICEHRVSPEPPKYHDKELCARVAVLEAQMKDAPAAAVAEITQPDPKSYCSRRCVALGEDVGNEGNFERIRRDLQL